MESTTTGLSGGVLLAQVDQVAVQLAKDKRRLVAENQRLHDQLRDATSNRERELAAQVGKLVYENGTLRFELDQAPAKEAPAGEDDGSDTAPPAYSCSCPASYAVKNAKPEDGTAVAMDCELDMDCSTALFNDPICFTAACAFAFSCNE